jgi:adenosine deaminase
VTVNTDNRLVTNTTVSKELWLCHKEMGFTFDDLKQVILSGFKSAFLPFHVKQQYLRRVSDELNAFVHEQAEESTRSLQHVAVATSPLPAVSPHSKPTVQLEAKSKSS